MNSRTILVAVAVLMLAAAAPLAVGCGTNEGSAGAAPTPAISPAASGASQPASSAAPAAATPFGGGVIKGVPTPSGWIKRTRNGIHDGGVHVRFTSDLSVLNVMSGYASLLTAAGWSIGSGGGGSQPGSGSLAANGPNGRFLALKVSRGGGGHTEIDLAVWPSKPSSTKY